MQTLHERVVVIIPTRIQYNFSNFQAFNIFQIGIKLLLLITFIHQLKSCFGQNNCLVSWPNSVICNQTEDFSIEDEFKMISKGLLKNQTHFKNLLLSKSGLKIIPSNPFSDITFDSIDIEYCYNLTLIGRNAFNETKDTLTRLNMYFTGVYCRQDPDYNVYAAINSLPNLHLLNVSLTNQLLGGHKISDQDFPLPQTRLISISFIGFDFDIIGNNSFNHLSNLQVLNFSQIYTIRHIAENAFNISGEGTVDVDLSESKLTDMSFDDDAFSESSKQLRISLINNDITLIEERIFGSFFEPIQNGTIDFNNNPLDCDQSDKFLWIINRKSELKSKLLNPYCKTGQLVFDINPNLKWIRIEIAIISLSIVLFLIFLLIIFLYYIKIRKEIKLLRAVVNEVKAKEAEIPWYCLETDKEVIGSGNYGVVYKALYTADQLDQTMYQTGPELVAVKTLKNGCSRMDKVLCFKEGLRFLNMKNERIVSPIGICIESGSLPLIIYPYMENGDLLRWLTRQPRMPQLQILIQFACQISQGMEFLSQKNFVHRDLAARNCLIDHNLNIKIGDFGLSRDLYSKAYYKSKNCVPLPVKWMAPEAIEKGIYCEATDVWAYGVLLWEILSKGCEPYPRIENKVIVDYIKSNQRLPKPSLCSDDLYENLLLKCWAIDSDLRPNFSAITSFMESVVIDETLNPDNEVYSGHTYNNNNGYVSEETLGLIGF